MRLTPAFHIIMQLAAHECTTAEFSEIEPEHMLMSLLRFSELDPDIFRDILRDPGLEEIIEHDRAELHVLLQTMNIDTTSMRRSIRAKMGHGRGIVDDSVIHRSDRTRQIFTLAFQAAIAKNCSALAPVDLLKGILQNPTPLLQQQVELQPPADPEEQEKRNKKSRRTNSPATGSRNISKDDDILDLGGLIASLRELRSKLERIVLGQDHAIDSFIEGLFSADVFAGVDQKRQRPKGIFIFAGPPGVGKTFLAESGAATLGRPFKRFDMSGFSGHEESHSLVGIHKSYKDAHAGILTGFVKENPEAILLFDEIEKAHLNTIHFFLQILDAGRLEDKFTEETIGFRDTIIIFTTNGGRALYDDPNRTGVHAANTSWHRKTILDALENEKDPRTGQPFFPAAICSRMATGYPIMFNQLGVNELEKISASALKQAGALMTETFSKPVKFGSLVPLCLLLREGVNVDARTITSQAESFVKEELFRFSLLFKKERLNQIIHDTNTILFDVDDTELQSESVRRFLLADHTPQILLIADKHLKETWATHLTEVEWHWADDLHDIDIILKNNDIDMVLLDLWVGQTFLDRQSPLANRTVLQFDYVPGAASDIAGGQEILRTIHDKHPETPCYLLSFGENAGGRIIVDDELFMACNRSGGARGIVETSFLSTDVQEWRQSRNRFRNKITAVADRLYRERKAVSLGNERKTLSFESVPDISNDMIQIRLRNLHFKQTLDATDVSAVLRDIERPTIGFADVYGADAAKSELEYIVKWLKNPRHYTAMGLRPPRGILLHGHPGTGKTLMARALAGESQVTFLASSATNFVTKWQGSGPENVRELFERARRYAPAIIFIDEIDAIGKKRGRGGGADSAAEQTLNSLLVEMDGFTTTAARPVIVMAATNLVEQLDDALRRRFDREIEVDRPDRAARIAYLRKRLTGRENRQVSETIINRLAGQSANMTIAELERIIELAGRMSVADDGVIDDQTIEEAFERMRMGESRATTDPQMLERVARHEAGHCLVGWLRGEKPVQVTIVARGKAGGYVERQNDEGKMLYTKPELEGMIRQAMAGRAAEIIYYGKEEGLSTGVESDLRSASRYAELMARDYGMAADIGQVAFDGRRLADGLLASRISRAVRKIVDTQLNLAVTELTENKKYLDLLVKELLEKNRLTLEELETLLPTV